MNLDGWSFRVFATASVGVVGAGTQLHMVQKGSRVFGRYQGGSIARGCLVGRVMRDTLCCRYSQRERERGIQGGRSTCVLEGSTGWSHPHTRALRVGDAGRRGHQRFRAGKRRSNVDPVDHCGGDFEMQQSRPMSSVNSESGLSVRKVRSDEGAELFDIWWRSATATHTFLSREELEALAPSVRALGLQKLDTWVLCDPLGQAIGFMVLSGPSIEALFIVPEWTGKGGGRQLVQHARSLRGRLRVDVNEQNAPAVEFYRAHGFRVVGRSETDGEGRPYPLLHLEELH